MTVTFESKKEVLEYMEERIGICDMDREKTIVLSKETFINMYLSLKGA